MLQISIAKESKVPRCDVPKRDINVIKKLATTGSPIATILSILIP